MTGNPRRAAGKKPANDYENRRTIPVTVSIGLSCGHNIRPSPPMPSIEAMSIPGQVIICDACDEYTVVERFTIRMVPNPDLLTQLIADGADLEPHFAAEVVWSQEERKRRRV